MRNYHSEGKQLAQNGSLKLNITPITQFGSPKIFLGKGNWLFRDFYTNNKKKIIANLFSTLFDAQLIHPSDRHYKYIS